MTALVLFEPPGCEGHEGVPEPSLRLSGSMETPGGRPDCVSRRFDREMGIRGALIEYGSGTVGFKVVEYGEGESFCVHVFGTEGTAHVPFYGHSWVKDQEGKAMDPTALKMPEKASPFVVAYDQIAAYLDGGPVPDCGPAEHRPVKEIAFGMMSSCRTGQKVSLPCSNRDRLVFAGG